MKLNKKLEEQGFIKIQNVVSKETISKLRDLTKIHCTYSGIKKHDGVRQPHAFRYAPFTLHIFNSKDNLKKEIINIFGKKWSITGHADLHLNALSGWHRDDGTSYGDGGYFGYLDYKSSNTGIYKIAIYFQSHLNFEDGLTVIPKSHINSEFDTNNPLHINSELGDIIIFDPRLIHTGQVHPIPKALSKDGLNFYNENENFLGHLNSSPSKINKILRDEFIRLRGDRMSLFFTIKLNDVNTGDWSKNNMNRQLIELANDDRDLQQPSCRLGARLKEICQKYDINYESFL